MTRGRQFALGFLSGILDVCLIPQVGLLEPVIGSTALALGSTLVPFVAAAVVLFALLGLYDFSRVYSRSVGLAAVGLAVVLTALAVALLARVPFEAGPWLTLVTWTVLVAVATRAILTFVARRLPGVLPILVVGTGPRSRQLAAIVARQRTAPVRFVGLIAEDADPASLRPDAIVLRPGPRPEHDARTIPVPDSFWTERHSLDLPTGPSIRPPEAPIEGTSRIVKRAFDFILAGLSLPVLVPLMAVVGVVVLVLDGRPVLYSQVRWTDAMRPFRLWKIRSMRRDAERDGPVWPRARDDRITPVGAVLRRLWLDEVPQIFAVLRGHLSLVGPRPERPEFAQGFLESIPMYHLRYRAKAGLTGLAQVQGYVGNTSIKMRLHCDLRYIDGWDPWLDVQILALTVARIWRRRARALSNFEPGGGERVP